MHTTISRAGWLVAGVLALFVVAAMTGVVRGGPLDPPGAPSATGTLPQVEPRSPIPPVGWNGTFPIVISTPGSYYFTRSVAATATNADGIRVISDNVTLDLNGFTLFGWDKTATGIAVIGQHNGIRISNGVIRRWAVALDGWSQQGEADYSHVDHVTALDNSFAGIQIGYDSEIIDCNASQNDTGVEAEYSIVRGCNVTDNATYGIIGVDHSLVEDNKLWNNGVGIWAKGAVTAGENTVRSNTSTNNVVHDLEFGGTGNVSDSNVVTCPGWVTGAGVQTFNQRNQRNVC
jgi:hypothetical protein